MRDLLFRSRIFTYLAAATPGLRELVTIGKIWEVAQPDRKVKKGRKYDLVIVDAPATGHGVALPPDAADVRQHRPRRADQGPGGGARDVHRQPSQDRRRDRRPARGDAGQRDRGARARRSTEEVGVAVDRVYMNGLYPERFCEPRARADRRRVADAGQRRRSRRVPRGAEREPPRRAPSASSSPGSRELVQAPVRTLPVRLRARARGRGDPRARRASSLGASADGRRRRAARGQAGLHLRRLGRRRKDDQLGGDRRRDGGAGQEGRGADDRPGQAARRLARPARARQRGAAGRPGAVRRRPASRPTAASCGR